MIASQALNSGTVAFGDVVRTATMVYNATPHGRLGASPHYAMFGCEMVFPGWQKLAGYATQDSKTGAATRLRIEAAIRARLRDFETYKVTARRATVRPGDWVRFQLGLGEKRSHYGSAGTTETEKWQPRWSLPCKVEQVKSGTVLVRLLGRPHEPTRKVPYTQIQVLPTEIPASIAGLNVRNIESEAPRFPLKYRIPPGEDPVTFAEVAEKARYKSLVANDSPTDIMVVEVVCDTHTDEASEVSELTASKGSR